MYKCYCCDKIGQVEDFCYNKLSKSKDGNPRPLRTTNTPRPKNIWVPKMKT